MDYVASNASVHTHAPFPLVGDYAPNPTEHRTHSVALRVLRILLKGMLKRRPLCRDVTNRYTLMRCALVNKNWTQILNITSV